MKNLSVAAVLGLILLGLAAGEAGARPRDDVLSGAFRCAAIGDSRTWLDCYYGAAQPVRAALGLQSVPQVQSRLVTRPPPGTPSSEDIALRDQVMAQAVRCAGLGDAHQWLGCYYAATQPLRAHLGLPGAAQQPVSQPSPSPQGPHPVATASAFGMPAPAPAPSVSPMGKSDHVSSAMASYSFDKFRWFTVKLVNGQVWRQLDGDTNFASWRKPARNYMVNISRGLFGSYNLRVAGQPVLFKVHRIQ